MRGPLSRSTCDLAGEWSKHSQELLASSPQQIQFLLWSLRKLPLIWYKGDKCKYYITYKLISILEKSRVISRLPTSEFYPSGIFEEVR